MIFKQKRCKIVKMMLLLLHTRFFCIVDQELRVFTTYQRNVIDFKLLALQIIHKFSPYISLNVQ